MDVDLAPGKVRFRAPVILRLPSPLADQAAVLVPDQAALVPDQAVAPGASLRLPDTGRPGRERGRPVVLPAPEPVATADGRDAADVPAGAAISLHRPGSSPRPICGGEPVAVRLAGAGYLVAGEPGSADVVVGPEPVAEWVVTGVAPGVAVPVGKPVGLFDTVHGDHLVCIPGPDLPVLAWMSTAGLPAPPLPIPARLRPPEGVPGDVELSGAVVPVRDGDLEAGLLLLLDPADGRALGSHLVRRVPDLAESLAPDAAVGAVACRWSRLGGPADVRPALPPAGARLWVQGALVADPGVSVSPVRALAWALDGDGEPVTALPGGPDWPQTVITWRVLVLPLPDDDPGGAQPCAFHLPLPVRDGEPGTTTTFTPLAEGTVGRTGDRRTPLRGAPAPALVPAPAGSRRVLRAAASCGPGGPGGVLGCTVRVHLPVPEPTGA